MAGANTNVQITDLDFDLIKNNLKNFLKSQDVLKDYNYEGSALAVLLDLLAYNTQYNAYYLNMVANEMFLDSALYRSSVVSHAKELGYTPKSAIAPTATINLKVNQVSDSSLTLPRYTTFLSEAIDGVNYNFVTTDNYTVNTDTNHVAYFPNVTIKQGIPASIQYTVNSITNPNYVFEIPNQNVDTTSLRVTVAQSSSNSAYEIYTLASNYTTLNGSSTVYFLNETNTGTYQISFGDGILGTQLTDGNIVNVNYVVTNGTSSAGANNFTLMEPISGYSNTIVYSVTSATNGGNKESIDSIKFQAPKAYSAQNRAVTQDDYITAIQQNTLGYSFDAVNVWSGDQNEPPVYGQVFISVKPAGAYTLTEIQKQQLINSVISPISVMTVKPVIVDPDYTYLKLAVNVLYDPKRTTLTSAQLQTAVTNAIYAYGNSNLNSFNSTFSSTDLTIAIKSVDQSIITDELSVQVQKKFYPTLNTSRSYKFLFGSPIQKNIYTSGINSSPSFQVVTSFAGTVNGVYLEEIPTYTNGVESISMMNPGFGYQYPPIVNIIGDGTGATATATINANGSVNAVTITNAGAGYTTAYVTFTPVISDTTGQGAAGTVLLQGALGTLRTYYNNTTSGKTIINPTAGTIDYGNGIITLNNFNISDVNNPLGQLIITATPTSMIVSSSYNRIITIDPFDPTAITVNVTAKT